MSAPSSSSGSLLACAVVALALAGCPAPRTFEIRVFDGSKVVATGASVALGRRVEGASATWKCAEVAASGKSVFERKRDGLLTSTLYLDVPLTCAIEVSAPGFETASLPVGAHCDELRGKECMGFHVSVALTKRDAPGVAASAPSAIPLDLPRSAPSGDVQIVLSVVLRANGTLAVDGKDVEADDEVVALARGARERGGADVRAVIKADAAVPHGRVVHVLDLLKQANVAKIAFGVSPTTPTPASSR